MRISKAFFGLSLAFTATASKFYRDYTTNDYFAVQLAPSTSPSEVAQFLGATWEGPLGELPDHHTFSSPRHRGHEVDEILQELRRRRRKRDLVEDRDALNGVIWSQKQKLKPRLQKRIPPPPLNNRQGPPAKDKAVTPAPEALKKLDEIANTLDIRDPIFKEQWHLFNPTQIGHDINVTGVWLQGVTGNGSITAIIDDGLDMYSDDLKDNYYAHGSYDFNDMREEPKPELFDDKHGTRCAGEVAAVRNDVCGVGVAYDSKVAGIRILSKLISDENEATAVNYGFQHNQIYSCSWGPPDDGVTMDAPGILIQRAMVNGVQHGRKGKGSIFVFAAGNGAAAEDNCNFDGYTNSIYSITVGAIDREGNHPYYSEKCSAQLVVAYSSGRLDAIHTTDVGTNKCFAGHGGTSAAGPLAAGVYALALSVRPDLNWRDIQYLTVMTAVPIHEDDGSWVDTPIGKKFSHTYGYGKVDAYALVEAAKDWQSVKPQAWFHSPWLRVNHPIPQGDQGLASHFEVTLDALKKANLETLEHVTLTMNVNHTRRGDLSVELKSPAGIVSHLSTTRRMDENGDGYVDWTFMSVAHWGENSVGNWTVIVKDTYVNDNKGVFTDWRLNLWGECINPANQTLHPLPNEHDDDHETASAPVKTTSVERPQTSDLPAKPTDHIDRPVNAKPTPTKPISTSPTSSSSPTPSSEANSSFLPSFFPTFGVSRKSQIWIYGAASLILVFCVALAIYAFIQRRKRLRNNPRDDYEFEMLADGEGDEGANGHANGVAGKKGKTRRAGELYDAFAGESDEEFVGDDGVFSDSEGEEPYKDRPEEGRGREGVDGRREES